LVCNDTGKQYIGSTTTKLTIRLCQHKRLFKDGRSGTSKEILENGNYNIVLLEDFPCERKEQLLQRERYYIETMECVNKKIPLRTHHEWYEDNKDEYIARQTIWNNNNKDKLKEYQNRFRNKNKGVHVDLTDIDDKENIKLEIEDIYNSEELIDLERSLFYGIIDEKINNIKL
jgi:hypothetical protein